MQNDYLENLKNNKVASLLLVFFFTVSVIEVLAEYFENKLLIWMTKPLILPILIAYYLRVSKKISPFFIIALLFSWVANLLFIQDSFQYIFYGVFFFLVYRILVIYIIVNKVKMPNSVPLILGCVPFIFLYVIVTLYTYDTLGNNVYLFLLQGGFTIFLGGFSLGNYIMVSNKPNSLLLISTMFMAFNQFIFLLKLYYDDVNVLQATAMILFVLGQFLLTRYMFYTEKSKHKYEVI
ncbi:lysoplasmalogenase family protein [Flavobacterium wongokense]|uniref:lysoplasmalogenase family protein n=1 Tax=Flavobacterium wongokense TaxID=2910674 RepID=UPI001F1EB628|nr:lysoplasmalogenase family protein [Flavobacterium sp. WG47]MCF6132066.1 lysoplasmalogenase [Flavobacterium sp. WG47]